MQEKLENIEFPKRVVCSEQLARMKNNHISKIKTSTWLSDHTLQMFKGFTGILWGNEVAGTSNLQGLWLTVKPCKNI